MDRKIRYQSEINVKVLKKFCVFVENMKLNYIFSDNSNNDIKKWQNYGLFSLIASCICFKIGDQNFVYDLTNCSSLKNNLKQNMLSNYLYWFLSLVFNMFSNQSM